MATLDVAVSLENSQQPSCLARRDSAVILSERPRRVILRSEATKDRFPSRQFNCLGERAILRSPFASLRLPQDDAPGPIATLRLPQDDARERFAMGWAARQNVATCARTNAQARASARRSQEVRRTRCCPPAFHSRRDRLAPNLRQSKPVAVAERGTNVRPCVDGARSGEGHRRINHRVDPLRAKRLGELRDDRLTRARERDARPDRARTAGR